MIETSSSYHYSAEEVDRFREQCRRVMIPSTAVFLETYLTMEPETEEERKFLASRPPIRISIPLVMCWRPPDAIPAE
jgi:hypothetical protein